MEMDVRQLTAEVSVAAQLQPADMAALARMGFRTVVNNRPDGEAETQPRNADCEQAARNLGLEYHYLPVLSGTITDSDVRDFGKLLQSAQAPLLAFCRSGTRCTMLWALAEAQHRTPDSIISTARSAGYDLEALRERLAARFGK